MGRGITGWVAETGRSVCVGDVRQDARYFGVRTNSRSEMCVPLKIDDQVIGIINIENTEIDAYNQDDLMFMEAVANQVAIAIENTRLHDQIRQHALDLEQHVNERTSELEHSLSLLRTTLESTADGILVLDRTGKKIVTYNQNFLDMWGISQALIETGDDDIVLESVLDQLKDPQGFLARVRALYRDPSAADYDLIEFHDGRLFERYSYPQRIGDTIIGRVWSFRDISEREKLGRLKNEFISVVSHELRTPLTSIHGALRLLEGGVGGVLQPQARDLVAVAMKNSDRLALLVDDILDLEKIESGSMFFENKTINLSDLVKQALETNKTYGAKYKVAFIPDTLLSDVKVMADPDRLMQVMYNLLSNAAKFSPTGENVTIRMSYEGDDVRVAVVNRGSGISEEARPHIFQKFYQADASNAREKGGTGLGLSICKSIIERLNGRIGFLSEPDKETVFYFDLPIWKKPAELI